MSLKEIAGLTDLQIAWVYFRPRDKYGRLQRNGRHRTNKVSAPKTHRWKECSYEDAYKRCWLERGMSIEQVEERWQAKLAASESLRRWVTRTRRR